MLKCCNCCRQVKVDLSAYICRMEMAIKHTVSSSSLVNTQISKPWGYGQINSPNYVTQLISPKRTKVVTKLYDKE